MRFSRSCDKQAGFEVRQEILPWQGILPGVASGKYDAAVTAAVITDERAKSLDFTMPISESTMAYVKRTGDDRIKSIKDLSGMTLGVQQGGASFQVLPDLEAELKKTGGKLGQIVQYGNFSEAYQDLVNKRLDAVIHNIVSLSTLTAEKPKLFELGQRVGDKSYAAWAVQKGNASLLRVPERVSRPGEVRRQLQEAAGGASEDHFRRSAEPAAAAGRPEDELTGASGRECCRPAALLDLLTGGNDHSGMQHRDRGRHTARPCVAAGRTGQKQHSSFPVRRSMRVSSAQCRWSPS